MRDIELRQTRVRRAGVGLNVMQGGEGPPVLLLHGFPEHWISWRRQITALAHAGFSVFAPDLRGYNLSDKPAGREAYHLRLLVEDVAALVRSTGHPRAHVVGHDWGGIVAWTFAGHHPALLDKLAVLNAPHLRIYSEKVRRPPQLFQSWYVLFFQLPYLPELVLSAGDFAAVRKMFSVTPAVPDAFGEEDIDRYVAALARPGSLTAGINYYRALRLPGALRLAHTARVSAETLVIWGEKDVTLSTGLLDRIERVAPRARVHRIPRAGHWVQNEAPDEVSRALVDFLQH